MARRRGVEPSVWIAGMLFGVTLVTIVAELQAVRSTMAPAHASLWLRERAP